MELDDLVEEITIEGLVEGLGAAAGIGLIIMVFFGNVLKPVIEALIHNVC